MQSHKVHLAWIGLAVAAFGAGCAGYRLGSTLPPSITSVSVPTFVNKTSEPQLESDATAAVIREFQNEGTLMVLGADEADTELLVVLTSFRLEPLRYEKDESKTAQEYRMRILATLTFKDIKTGQVLMDRSVEGKTTFPFAGDLGSSKQAALPRAAADLAHNIVETVVEFW